MSHLLTLRRTMRVALTVIGAAWISSSNAVTVVEYYHRGLDAYFITGRASEQAALDRVPEFRRTGMTFQATDASAALTSMSKICRFYLSLPSPFTNSHFYGREGADCEGIRAQNVNGFNWEGYDFAVPEASNNVCPTGNAPLYRSFRAGIGSKTPNHRYTVSPEACAATAVEGYTCEGRVFCGGAVTPATAPPVVVGSGPRGYQGTFLGGQQNIVFTGTVSLDRQSNERGPNGEPIYRVTAATTNLSPPLPECSNPGAVSLDIPNSFLAVTVASSGQASYGGLFKSIPVPVSCPAPPGPPAVVPFGYIWFTCLSENNVLQNQTSATANRLQGSCNANDGASFSWDFVAIP
jgi:hypothetical protein